MTLGGLKGLLRDEARDTTHESIGIKKNGSATQHNCNGVLKHDDTRLGCAHGVGPRQGRALGEGLRGGGGWGPRQGRGATLGHRAGGRRGAGQARPRIRGRAPGGRAPGSHRRGSRAGGLAPVYVPRCLALGGHNQG
jgi:hypothetical protein